MKKACTYSAKSYEEDERLIQYFLDNWSFDKSEKLLNHIDDKVKRLVTVDRDDRWKDLPRFILSSRIELLTELHDIHTLGTQSGSNGR